MSSLPASPSRAGSDLWKPALLPVLILLCGGPARAQDEESLGSKTLEELLNVPVAAASRTTTQQSREAPATVQVVTAEQIRLRGYQSLLDVFQDLPDFKIDSGNDPRWMHDVTIRGVFGMDKFIILIDGIRASSPTNDIIPVMENYPVNFAKQIEIVYGPASALYGADALSGVVNIITKRAEELEGRTELSVSGGTHRTFTGNATMGKKLGKTVDLTVAGQYCYDRQPDLARYYPEDFAGGREALRTGTFNTVFGPMTPRAPVIPEAVTPLSAYSVHAALGVGKLRLAFFRNHSRNPTSVANNPNNNLYNQSVFIGHSVTVLSGTYTKDFERARGISIVTGSRYDLDPESNFRNVFTGMEPAYLFSYGWMLKSEQLLSWTLDEHLTLGGGATYERFFSIPRGHDLQNPVYDREDPTEAILGSRYPLNPEGIPADFPKVRYSNYGGFVQAQYKPEESVALTLGGRFDHNTRFGSTFNPRLGVVWRPRPKLTVKALYGSAFLAPSPLAAFDQFGTFISFDQGLTYQSFFFRLPNPDLKAQKARTVELGVRAQVRDDLSLSATGHYSRLSGLFRQVNDAEFGNRYGGRYKGWPVGFIETVINQGAQKNYGGSLQADYLKAFAGGKRVAAYAALSLIDGRVDPDDDGPMGEVETGGIAPVIFRTGGEVAWGKFSASPRLVLVGRQRTHPVAVAAFSPSDPRKRQTLDGYPLVNLALTYQVGSSASVFAKATNLLDVRYRTVNLGAAPETGAQGSAQVEFAKGAPQNPLRVNAGVRVWF